MQNRVMLTLVIIIIMPIVICPSERGPYSLTLVRLMSSSVVMIMSEGQTQDRLTPEHDEIAMLYVLMSCISLWNSMVLYSIVIGRSGRTNSFIRAVLVSTAQK